MGSKTSRIVGWTLSGLLVAMLIFASAMSKFTQWEGKSEMFAQLGWTESLMFRVGIVEVAISLLFLVPRTSFVAAVLLSAYLGGAVAAHVRVDEAFIAPIIVGLVVWIALGLRQPCIFRLAMGLPGAIDQTSIHEGNQTDS